MPALGYKYVVEQAYIAFDGELDVVPWAGIPASDTMATDALDPAATASLGLLSWWKVQLRRATRAARSIDLQTAPLAALDTAWDNAQRRLTLSIEFAEHAPDAPTVATATRLRTALLSLPTGVRTQTQLSFSQEVDFGRNQGLRAQEPGVHADIATLGLGAVMAEVAAATRALAEGVGTPSSSRLRTHKAEATLAHRECVSTFNLVHNEMLWFLSNTSDGPQRTTVTALVQSLEDLLSRYPAPVRTATAAPAPTAPAPGAPAPLPVPTPGSGAVHTAPAVPVVGTPGPGGPLPPNSPPDASQGPAVTAPAPGTAVPARVPARRRAAPRAGRGTPATPRRMPAPAPAPKRAPAPAKAPAKKTAPKKAPAKRPVKG